MNRQPAILVIDPVGSASDLDLRVDDFEVMRVGALTDATETLARTNEHFACVLLRIETDPAEALTWIGGCTLPLVAVTPDSSDGHAVALLRAGAHEVVAGTRDALPDAIRRAIARHEFATQRSTHTTRLLQADRASSLATLAGDISLGFAELLGSVTQQCDIALRSLGRDDKGWDSVNRIAQDAARAAELARQMLAYSGGESARLRRLSLPRLVQDSVAVLEGAFTNDVTIECQIDSPSLDIEADAKQIRNVLRNLVLNATEAIAGSGTVSIRVGKKTLTSDNTTREDLIVAAPGEYAFIEVCDTGGGMDPATEARMFDPFFSTKFAGRGLGLATTLGAVRSHRGAVSTNSVPGEGSTVCILLPLAKAAAPEDDFQCDGRVLVIEDNEELNDLVQSMLRQLGFEPHAVHSGQAGIDYLESIDTDVRFVLLDLTMPGMSGEQTFEEIQRRWPGTPVVLMSGYARSEPTQALVEKGLAGFLPKPFTIQELLEHAKRAMSSTPTSV